MSGLKHTDAQPMLSLERLRYWTNVAGGDAEFGLTLHHRNSLIAGILHADLMLLEVSLRNAFDALLQDKFKPHYWPDLPELVRTPAMKTARSRAQTMSGKGRPIRHDKLMVNLNLSFWVELFGRKKFRKILAGAFKTGDIAKIKRDLDHLKDLRNDIAHHEPIIDRDGRRRAENLREDLDLIHGVVGNLNQKVGDWLKVSSSIKKLVDSGFVSCDRLKEHEAKIYIP